MTMHHRHTTRRVARPTPRATASEPRVCALSGAVRYIDGGGRWATLAVREASAAAQDLIGSTVSIDLGGAHFSLVDRNGDGFLSARDLVCGDQVLITADLPSDGPTRGMLRVRSLSHRP